MYFDGSISKEGAGAGISIISPNRDFKVYSYKLTFERTKNVAGYEALLLGLNVEYCNFKGYSKFILLM